VGVAVLEKLGGQQVLDWLVRAGDSLPQKGKRVFKAGESLKTGAGSSLNFSLWEGEIDDPITDNRYIGTLKISGNDFDEGVIPAGADLLCDYEILDSGTIVLEVSVPCIGGTFHSGRNFYSRQEGQLDFSSAAAQVVDEGEATLARVEEINAVVEDPKLQSAREKLDTAVALDPAETETEKTQEAQDKILEAKKLLAQVKKEHRKEIRQLELDGVTEFFNHHVREYARPSEATAFDNLVKTAQRSIERNDKDFENQLNELKGKNFQILWRQDWFVVDRFQSLAKSPHHFADRRRHQELVSLGTQFLQADDIGKLREIVAQLFAIQIDLGSEYEMFDAVNIIRG